MIELSFGEAIIALKQGSKVARKGWNGKNMHIFLEEHFSVLINMSKTRKIKREYEPVICMWTAQETTQPGWTPSQQDILAEDWIILPT